MQRKLTAILSADVKGYSRLMGDDEVATIHTLTAYREVLTRTIEERRGRVVDAPGDNLLAEFASVVDAVQGAVEIQKELGERNAALPDERKMEFRIGINLGDVVIEGKRIYGDGVNIAARVEGLAEGGGICISGTVYEHVENKLALSYEFLGEQQVKNIAKPVRMYRVLLKGGHTAAQAAGQPPAPSEPSRRRRYGGWLLVALCVIAVIVGLRAFRRDAPRPIRQAMMRKIAALRLPDKPSIAVLPFTNLGPPSDHEYFSDGITEDIITDLSKISGLFVIARNSVFTYKGKAVKPQQVARELGVRYILEGSVRKAGNTVRINAQLIDAATGYHLWADRYDRDLKDIFALQDEINKKIVAELKVQLTTSDQQRLARKETGNLEAYDLYLRSVDDLWRPTKASIGGTRTRLRRAVALDPKFAAAYALLARSYWLEWANQWNQDPQTLQQADRLAQQAIVLDADSAEARSILGYLYLWQKKHDLALATAKKSLDLEPNNADRLAQYGSTFTWSGRPEEALPLLRKAVRLDPHPQAWYLYEIGHALRLLGRLDEAIDAQQQAIAINANFVGAHAELAVAYVESGRIGEARTHAAIATKLSPNASIESLRKSLPYKNPEHLERYLAGFRKLGML